MAIGQLHAWMSNVSQESTCLGGVMNLAFLVIGCVGVSGALSPTVMGGGVIGLSVPFALGGVLLARQVRKRPDLSNFWAVLPVVGVVVQVAYAILGALTVAALVSPSVMGWCMIGPAMASLLALCCCLPCCVGLVVARQGGQNA